MREIAKIFRTSENMIRGLKVLRGSIIVNFNISNKVKIDNLLSQNYTLTGNDGKQYLVKAVSSGMPVESTEDDESETSLKPTGISSESTSNEISSETTIPEDSEET